VKFFVSVFTMTLAVIGLLNLSASSLPSENIVITQVQTGGSGTSTASQEYALLYNSSAEDINVTSWCLEYSPASGGVEFLKKLACIESELPNVELWLEAEGFVSFTSAQFIEANPDFIADLPLSSGIAASGGHIRLVDNEGTEIDRVGWGAAALPEGEEAALVHEAGEVLSRDFESDVLDTDENSLDFISTLILTPIVSGLYEKEILIDLCSNIDGIQAEIPTGYLVDDIGECWVDVCPNIDGLQVEIPEGFYVPEGETDCVEVLVELEDSSLLVTELLANAPSFDDGQEFIEIYNPNQESIELAGYVLQLGPSFSKQYVIENGTIAAGEYITLSDTLSGITLPNSSASIRLVAPAGNVVSETDVYSNPGDDVSWALIDDVWGYTDHITPAAANKPSLEPVVEEVSGAADVLEPCPAGKFRNPATNRCKTIEAVVSQLAPCGLGEFRNPATNRCKKITATTSTLTPCAAGQFRNPETNRCKSISTTSSTGLKPCDEGEERNPDTNRCRKAQVLGATSDGKLPAVTDIEVENTEGNFNWLSVAVVALGMGSYMAYEWRTEISRKLQFIKMKRGSR